MDAVTTTIVDGRLDKVIELVKALTEGVQLNSNTIKGLEAFNQTVGAYLLQLTDLVKNNLITMKGVFNQVTEALQLLELTQNIQSELINSLQTLVHFNTGLGVFNTVLIFIIGMVLIRRK